MSGSATVQKMIGGSQGKFRNISILTAGILLGFFLGYVMMATAHAVSPEDAGIAEARCNVMRRMLCMELACISDSSNGSTARTAPHFLLVHILFFAYRRLICMESCG